MSEQQYHATLYLVPIAVSWLITLILTVLAFRRRNVTGGIPFAISLALETLWISGYLLELVSPQLEDKIFWDNLQSFGTFFAPLGFLVFASEYSGRRSWKKWKLWATLAMPGIIYILLAYTNQLHHLTMVNQRLIHEFPFDNYTYDFGLTTYVVMIYSYVLMLFAIHLLGKQYIRQTGIFRRQTGFVLAGLVIPVLGSLTIFINIPDIPQRDLSPYYFALADLFIAYGVFRSHLLNIVPVARDLIIEHMDDGILIVDPMGRLLDLNAAAIKILRASAPVTIGQPLTNLLPEGLALIGHAPDAKTIRKEIILHHSPVPEIIDLRITQLPNRNGHFSGHMLILRDITLNKQREDMLRYAQDELEQRVSERTAALEAANQHLQAEAEHRTRSEQEKENQHREMEILHQFTVDLAALPVGADIESAITSGLKQLTSATVASMAEYNPSSQQLVLRHLDTEYSIVQEASRLLGQKVSELSFPVSPQTYAMLVETNVIYYKTLSEATLGVVPPPLGKVFEKLFKLNFFIGFAIQHDGQLIGVLMLMLSKEQKAPSDWLAKAVSNVLSIIYRRKLAEAGQRESENRFHSLAEMLPQPIYECDLTGRITYANRKAFETFGYTHGEPDLNVLNFIAKSSHETVIKSFQHMAQDPAERHREYLAQRKDGSTFPVLAYSAPILQGSKPIGLRGVLVDFTELKTSEDALRASEEKFRSIIEQSSDGFLLASESGELLEINQAFEQIYGMTRQELLGKPFWEITQKLNYVDNRTPDPLGDAKKHLEEITQRELDNQTIRQESEFITPDGRRRVIQRTAFPVKMSQGLRMAAVVSDITERKDAEREQRRLNRRLAMLSECNQSLIRMDRDEDLLRAICKTIVQLGDYRYAWIGMTQDSGLHKVIPVISYGDDGDYLDQMLQCDNPDEHCLRSYILERIQTLSPTIIDDIRVHPDFAPYREGLNRYGFISMMIFPLTSGDELFGSLNIYSASAFTPDSNELDLLTEMANDVSFGIHARRMHIARDRAEQKALQANIELHEAYEATLEGWSRALELRERETAGHSQRVVNLTLAIAEKMGLPKEDFVHIRRGALLHDIGKMGIPDHILLKREPLTDAEWVTMRQHPQMAFNLLAKIPYLAPALDIPYCHHEHWDGSGYPRGLKGEEIPFAARIFMVVDIWDALTFDRPYRPAWTKEATSAYLIAQAGTHLDPRVVAEFLQLTDPTELIASPSKET